MPSRPGELLTTTSAAAHRMRPSRSARATTVKSRPRGWRGRRRGRADADAIGCIVHLIARTQRGLRTRLEQLTYDRGSSAAGMRRMAADQGLERLANPRLLGRRGFVEAPDRRRVRGRARDVGVLAGLAQDLGDRLGERVERLARLGLRRLDEQ